MSPQRLQQVGSGIWFAGGLLIAASLAFKVGSPANSLFKSFLLIGGAALVGSGLCVRFNHLISPKLLRVLDLIWISASAVSLSLAVSQFYYSQYSSSRIYLYSNVKEAQENALKMLSQFEPHCENGHSLPGAACGWASRMSYEIKNNKLASEEVSEFCPKPVAIENPFFSLCIALNYVSSVQSDEISPETSSLKLLENLRYVLQLGIVVAVAARFAKSIFEVFLLD